jgi:hypothetical protein
MVVLTWGKNLADWAKEDQFAIRELEGAAGIGFHCRLTDPRFELPEGEFR